MFGTLYAHHEAQPEKSFKNFLGENSFFLASLDGKGRTAYEMIQANRAEAERRAGATGVSAKPQGTGVVQGQAKASVDAKQEGASQKASLINVNATLTPENAQNASPEALPVVANETATGQAPTAGAGQPASDYYQSPFQNSAESEAFSFSSLLIRMGVILAILIAGAFFWVRYSQKKRLALLEDNPLVKVVVSFPLQLDSRLMIIRVVNDYHVLVVSGDGVTPIDRISDKVSIDEIKIVENQTGASNPTFFKDLLSNYGRTFSGAMGAKTKAKSSNPLAQMNALAFTKTMAEKMRKRGASASK